MKSAMEFVWRQIIIFFLKFSRMAKHWIVIGLKISETKAPTVVVNDYDYHFTFSASLMSLE